MKKVRLFHNSVVPNNYAKMTASTMSEADYAKAVRMLNARIERMKGSEYEPLTNLIEMSDLYKAKLRKNFSPLNTASMVNGSKMLTKSGKFSTSLKGMTEREQNIAKQSILNLIKNPKNATKPQALKFAKQRAAKLGTSVDQYMKDKDFWKTFRDVMKETEYGSDEVFNAVELAEQLDYEHKKSKAKEILDEYDKFRQSGIDYDDESQVEHMSYNELYDIISGTRNELTNERVNKRSVREKRRN